MMKTKNPFPATPSNWFEEIARAYQDAQTAIPFGPLVGREIRPDDLFHLAPEEGHRSSLCSYVGTTSKTPGIMSML